MGATTFTPPRKPGDPEVEAMTATFAHHDGMNVLHETIQYLAERSTDERGASRAALRRRSFGARAASSATVSFTHRHAVVVPARTRWAAGTSFSMPSLTIKMTAALVPR